MAANRSLVRSVLRNLTICMLCGLTASGAAGVALAAPSTGASPLAITLDLGIPNYGACGDVSINGYVHTDIGSITRMSWNWGDGVVADSWFPATHRYATNGTYLVQVTAFTSTGVNRTEEVTAGVTNAGDPGCGPSAIVIDLQDPAYGVCGDVSIDGYVHTDIGSITRMSWDWGDGIVADSWFPATHHYAADGDYQVQVTAYAAPQTPGPKASPPA